MNCRQYAARVAAYGDIQPRWRFHWAICVLCRIFTNEIRRMGEVHRENAVLARHSALAWADLKERLVTKTKDPVVIDHFAGNLMKMTLGLGFRDGEAENLVQDTMLSFITAREKSKGPSVETYLFGILYHKARDRKRKRIREEAPESVEDNFQSHFDEAGRWTAAARESLRNPALSFDRSDLGLLMQDCLEKVDVLPRMAFTLEEAEGALDIDICLSLGLATPQLSSTLFRVRNQLRECLKTKLRLA